MDRELGFCEYLKLTLKIFEEVKGLLVKANKADDIIDKKIEKMDQKIASINLKVKEHDKRCENFNWRLRDIEGDGC